MSAADIPGISQRVLAVAESATVAITTQAKAMRAAGAPVIGYGAGEPDFATPDHIVEAAVAAARDPKNHKYTPAVGLPEMREAVAAVTARNSGYQSVAQQVVITNGGKQAVHLTCQALIDPGDEVLLPAPYWVTYPEAIKLSDGVPIPIVTDERSGYRVTVDQLEAARTDKTKMLIFVSPSNPSGAVYTSVGTYDHKELISLVVALSKESGVPVPDLVKTYGKHLLGRFVHHYPQFFENESSTLDFIEKVEDYIHGEVVKLYPEAKTPKLDCVRDGEGRMSVTYESCRGLADAAHPRLRRGPKRPL